MHPHSGPLRGFLRWRESLVRNSEAGDLIELFLVAAIASVLVIRVYLVATGYPQLGGGGLHIAHMLWGGALMLAALLLIFTFLNRQLQRPAAVLGGAGFGVFIDEVGKFVTSDNDYFFQPAIGIIYVVFIAIFLVMRAVRRTRPLTPQEALSNALNQIVGAVGGPMDPKARAHTIALLDASDPSHPLTSHLRAYVEEVGAQPDDAVGFYFRLRERLLDRYERLVRTKRFAAVFLSAFVVFGVFQVLALGLIVLDIAGQTSSDGSQWIRLAQGASTFASGACVLIGAWLWRSSRPRAYRWYIRATLVSIFVTQVFVFFDSELAAMYGLAASVAFYAALRALANLEEEAGV